MIFLNLKHSAPLFFLGALCFLLLTGCVARKPSVKLEAESEEYGYVGSITNEFAKDGCPWLIVYKDGAEDNYLIPVQLEDGFKKNGLKVEFMFHYSRISQGDCQMGQPAVLEEIHVK